MTTLRAGKAALELEETRPEEIGQPRQTISGGTPEHEARQRLLDATDRVVHEVTIAKLSMADVARAAGVARGTLYRYFESRDVLLDAMMARASDRFFADVARAMDKRATLSDQLGEFSTLQIRSTHPRGDIATHREAMLRELTREGTRAMRRTTLFLVPYVEAARQRGEIRPHIDVADASAWLARILLSFSVFQASFANDPDDPESVSSFVRRYAIDGLAAR